MKILKELKTISENMSELVDRMRDFKSEVNAAGGEILDAIADTLEEIPASIDELIGVIEDDDDDDDDDNHDYNSEE